MQPHSSQSSRENATPSSGTSPLASYKGVPPPPPPGPQQKYSMNGKMKMVDQSAKRILEKYKQPYQS